jgi:type II secretory pathway pseudopilin PulG
LLVVIALMAILLQLLVPSVVQTRASSRSIACKNNLKQLSTAAIGHLSSQRFFPSGGWSGRFTGDAAKGYGRSQPGGWMFSVIAYTDDALLRKNCEGESMISPELGLSLEEIHTSSLPYGHCPSRRVSQPYPILHGQTGSWRLINAVGAAKLAAVTKSDYAANSGDSKHHAGVGFSDIEFSTPMSYGESNNYMLWTDTGDANSEFFQTGVIHYRSEIRPKHISDGLSKTYLFGEKFMEPAHYYDISNARPPAMYGDNQSAWAGFDWDNHRIAWQEHSLFPKEFYRPQRDRNSAGLSSIVAFGSAHPSSWNSAYCDASVRSVGYGSDLEVHRAAANRMDLRLKN